MPKNGLGDVTSNDREREISLDRGIGDGVPEVNGLKMSLKTEQPSRVPIKLTPVRLVRGLVLLGVSFMSTWMINKKDFQDDRVRVQHLTRL